MANYGSEMMIDVSIFTSMLNNGFVKPPAYLVPERIIFNDPATIVYWQDGTKTVVMCMEGDTFSEDIGFTAALAKKVYGGHNQYKRFIRDAQRQEKK